MLTAIEGWWTFRCLTPADTEIRRSQWEVFCHGYVWPSGVRHTWVRGPALLSPATGRWTVCQRETQERLFSHLLKGDKIVLPHRVITRIETMSLGHRFSNVNSYMNHLGILWESRFWLTRCNLRLCMSGQLPCDAGKADLGPSLGEVWV